MPREQLAARKVKGLTDSRWERMPIPGSRGLRFAVNAAKLKALVDDLAVHAQCWPVRFADEQQRAAAAADADNAAKLVGLANAGRGDDVPMLVLAGRLAAIQHDLEQPSADVAAETCFRRALTFDPKHAEANLFYGVFLAGSAVRLADARARFEAVAAQGEPRAWQHLGAVHLLTGDRREALRAFAEHLQTKPGDVVSTAAVAAIREGTSDLPGK